MHAGPAAGRRDRCGHSSGFPGRPEAGPPLHRVNSAKPMKRVAQTARYAIVTLRAGGEPGPAQRASPGRVRVGRLRPLARPARPGNRHATPLPRCRPAAAAGRHPDRALRASLDDAVRQSRHRPPPPPRCGRRPASAPPRRPPPVARPSRPRQFHPAAGGDEPGAGRHAERLAARQPAGIRDADRALRRAVPRAGRRLKEGADAKGRDGARPPAPPGSRCRVSASDYPPGPGSGRSVVHCAEQRVAGMAFVVAVAQQKGGAGKSTVAANLAAALGRAGAQGRACSTSTRRPRSAAGMPNG